MKFLIPLTLFTSVALARAMPAKRDALAAPVAAPDALDILARSGKDKDKNKDKGKDNDDALKTKTKSEDGPHATTSAPALPTPGDDDKTKTVTVTVTVTLGTNGTIALPTKTDDDGPTGVITPSLIAVLSATPGTVENLSIGPKINDLQAPPQVTAV